ncbi:MAG TPA: alpha-glucuronidase family glycosyl hydrolase [Bacteroidota bacterium]|nr:alpha-glucuronidase family glycosyl hydrolase [Bacteroidota bacterium]
MKHSTSLTCTLLFLLFSLSFFSCATFADDGYRLWLKYPKVDDAGLLEQYRQSISSVVLQSKSKTCTIIQHELKTALPQLLDQSVSFQQSVSNGTLIIGTPAHSSLIKKLKLQNQLDTLGKDGYLIHSTVINKKSCMVIASQTDIGTLYGTFHFLRLLQTHQSLTNLSIASRPKIQYRILDHWDNIDSSIERGYAGKSLWHWNELPEKIDNRYDDYARADASLGINGVVLNNVNANPIMLTPEYLKKVAALANIFRPYGIRVYLSANFASPISASFAFEENRNGGIGNLRTSDPLDPAVRLWWKNKVKEIYSFIPDFGGFLVKANSEGMPGPQDYNRTHADGANMLAEALQPYGGIVMWRAFVYNAETDPDRAKRAYKEFVPLDGKFLPNVFVQAKNGPIDFQPREPVQPLFGAMPKTPLMLELQLTQEYLGHSTHLVYLAPMWKEYLDVDTYARGKGSTLGSIIDGSLEHYSMTGIAGVANIGDDRNWCGHFFAQSNWFAYGRLAWDYSLSSEQIAEDWIRMSISNNPNIIKTVSAMMLGSREACVNYMTPLGLHHIMQVGFHYGPMPQHDTGRIDWRSTYYHRADSIGLGFDRSSTGSNYTGQYASPLRETYDNIQTCPEQYLLWFHHVPWNFKMKSGRTLWNELCVKYYSGTDFVDTMLTDWNSLQASIDPEIYQHVKARLEKQKIDAGIWRDTCLHYFQKFSKQPIHTMP